MKTLAIKQLLKYSEFTTEQVILDAIQSLINMKETEHDECDNCAVDYVSYVLNREVKHPKAFARQYLTSRVSRDIYLMENEKPMLKRYFIESHLPEIVMIKCSELEEELSLNALRVMRGEIMEIYREQWGY